MEDIFFVTKCDHKITGYELKIKGEPGNYYAVFPVPPVALKNRIYIRSWNDEQEYLKKAESYKTVQSAIFNKNMSAPISGANAIIGITDYEFVDDVTIKFLTPSAGKPTVNPDPNIIPNNKYLVDFTAKPETCPRCNGTGVIKDLNINQSGSLEYVTGANKIKQQVLKTLMTPLGSSPYDVSYGSELNSLIGQVITDNVRITLQKTIQNAVQNLIDKQGTNLTDEERINAIQGITIDTPDTERTLLYVTVLVSSVAGELIDCSIGFDLEDK